MSDRRRKKTFPKDKGGNDLKPKIQAISNTGGGILTNHSKLSIKSPFVPPELWELIFKNLESPKDLMSCWNTTYGWRKGLQSTDFYFKMTLPFILPYLNSSDILKCCLVSKSWKKTVDVCIQTAQDFETDSHRQLNYEQLILFRLDSNDFTDFVNRVMCTNNKPGKKVVAANPVVFRRVTVHFSFAPDHDDVPITVNWENLLKCLDHHGHLIHHFNLSIDDEDNVSSLDKIKFIRNCLERTPNVRVFNISITCPDTDVHYDGDLDAYNQYDSQTPWPTLEHLKMLKFVTSDHRKEYISIANAYAPQLVNLHFSSQLIEVLCNGTGRFSCLQKIDFLLLNICHVVEFKTFLELSKCPLKDLSIGFLADDNPDFDYATELTVAINTVSGTLETLSFLRSGGRSTTKNYYDITKFDQLRLPRLKSLRLCTFGYPSLEFLTVVCPALQKLRVLPMNFDSLNVLSAGDMYCNLYVEHQFWNELAHIQTVDVQIFSKFNDSGSRRNLIRRVPVPGILKRYTRVGYIAKLEVEHAVGQRADVQTSTKSRRKARARKTKKPTASNEERTTHPTF